MNIVSNSHEVDWQIAQLFRNYIVGVTLRSGDIFDMRIDDITPDGFVTLVGPRVTFIDEFGLPEDSLVEHEQREVTLIDIAQLEVF